MADVEVMENGIIEVNSGHNSSGPVESDATVSENNYSHMNGSMDVSDNNNVTKSAGETTEVDMINIDKNTTAISNNNNNMTNDTDNTDNQNMTNGTECAEESDQSAHDNSNAGHGPSGNDAGSKEAGESPVSVPTARVAQGQSPTKSPWYGTYVRRLSISSEAGKGMNVKDLYPYSNPGSDLKIRGDKPCCKKC